MRREFDFDDSVFISPEKVSLYANTNEAQLRAPVKGIVVELPGLGGGSCLGGSMDMGGYSTEHAVRFAEKGILLAYMFPGPWSWGSRSAVRYADMVTSALCRKHGLKDPKVAVCGGSMGGLGTLIYAADSRFEICGAAAACPCLDVIRSFNVLEEAPRSLVSAACQYDMPLEDALKEFSPAHRREDLPKVPYFICSDGADALFPEEECGDFVKNLREMGHSVTYRRQPGLGHGDFESEVREELHIFLESLFLKENICGG